MQGRVLAGETVDLTRLVAAHSLLQKMLPGGALVAPASAAGHDFSGAREELRHFLIQRADAIESREVRETERLREQVVTLTEENSKLLAKLRAAEQQQPAKQPRHLTIHRAATRTCLTGCHYSAGRTIQRMHRTSRCNCFLGFGKIGIVAAEQPTHSNSRSGSAECC
jgi:hypothetical protein